jgi:hypothetical protein
VPAAATSSQVNPLPTDLQAVLAPGYFFGGIDSNLVEVSADGHHRPLPRAWRRGCGSTTPRGGRDRLH